MEKIVLSPSYGHIVKANRYRTTIFIPINENHKLFAPISGTIYRIFFKNGKFEREIFETKLTKRGRMTMFIDDIIFHAEVGFPYRVKRIQIYPKEGYYISAGQKIGEILLGSLTEIIYPPNVKVEPLVKYQEKVIGGQTLISKINY